MDVLLCGMFQRAVTTLRKLEAEKASIQRETEPLLSRKSLDPSTVSYPPKLSTATNKIEDLNTLTDLYGKKYVFQLKIKKQTSAQLVLYLDDVLVCRLGPVLL